ncbi:MAG TPA: TlpA disulfide reductase family protein [Acidimicrobiales bacterium]|nr:TlpA disulfide reductase family protein [Acidimicrobiales bacterium]
MAGTEPVDTEPAEEHQPEGSANPPPVTTGTGSLEGPPPTDASAGAGLLPNGVRPPPDGGGGTDHSQSGRPRRRARPVFLMVGIVLAVALGIGLFTGVGTGKSGGRPVAGDPVPSFSLPRVGGGASVGVPSDGGGNGRPAILLFFASWCQPCQTEVPAIAATYHRQQIRHSRLATTVALLGVVGSDPTATAIQFMRRSGVTFPSGADKNYAVTEGLFYFSGLPETVFVSATGTIAAVHYGAISTATFVRWQRRLLQGG